MLKTFCGDHQQINHDLKLNEGEWRRIRCLIKFLETVYVAIKMLQKSDLTIRDFYGIWIQTKNKLNQINSTLSLSILNTYYFLTN
ncbi:Uncharacterized protein FWK35_00035523 [Aphis craccivora]|uniref:Zinc finger MYM-type protein 1-like n=1 Tax=Aphis craccivora TaxID=307492 RepID=A0A6G0VNQ0_APHCR|nr:Uncharacterized protein FWK35_00035523 [Aphis craccivora]